VQVLVVEAHKGQLNAFELTFGHDLAGRPKAKLANTLPISIGGRAHADAWDAQNFGADIRLCKGPGWLQNAARASKGSSTGQGGGTLKEASPRQTAFHGIVVKIHFH
jgi:hypothetical protein